MLKSLLIGLAQTWLLTPMLLAQGAFTDLPLQPVQQQPDLILAMEKPSKPYVKMMMLEETGNAFSPYHQLLDSMQKRAMSIGADALWLLGTQPRIVAETNGVTSIVVLQAVALKYADNLGYISNYPQSMRLKKAEGKIDTIALHWDYRVTTPATASQSIRWLMQNVLPWIPPIILPAQQPGYSYKWNASKNRLRIKDANNEMRFFDYEMEDNILTKVEYSEIWADKRIKQRLEFKLKDGRIYETRMIQDNTPIWHHYYNYDAQGRLSSIEQWVVNNNNRSRVFELFIDYRSAGDLPKTAIIDP